MKINEREKHKKSASGPDYPRIPWHIADILDATRGEVLIMEDCQLKAAESVLFNPVFSGIAIDSRTVAPDELFAAVKGHAHDGHAFIGDVIKKGVSGIIIAKDRTGNLPCAEGKGKKNYLLCGGRYGKSPGGSRGIQPKAFKDSADRGDRVQRQNHDAENGRVCAFPEIQNPDRLQELQ